MLEGKNIHCSPVDQKLLCSYSSKVCRQRRLNGFGFCIRHILEDSTAPYKQCNYVTTRNTSQKCLNAIPESEQREYCHSHLQVTGAIPKTERKSKTLTNKCVVGVGKQDSGGGGSCGSAIIRQWHSSSQNLISSNSSPDVINNHSSNNYNNNNNNNNLLSNNNNNHLKSKSKASVKLKDSLQLQVVENPQTATTEQNNNTHSITNHIKINGLSTPIRISSADDIHHNNDEVLIESATSLPTTKATANGKKRKAMPMTVVKGKQDKKKSGVGTGTSKTQQAIKKKKAAKTSCAEDDDNENEGNLSIHDLWKSFKSNNADGHSTKTSSSIANNTTFHELKQLKIMERCPLFAQKCGKSEINSNLASSSYHNYNYLEQQQEQKNQYNNNNNNNVMMKCNGKSTPFLSPSIINNVDYGNNKQISRTLPKVTRHLDPDIRLTARKDFLHQVKSAYRSKLETIRRINALNDKKQEDSKALRNFLLTSPIIIDNQKVGSSAVAQLSSTANNSNTTITTNTTKFSTNNVDKGKGKGSRKALALGVEQKNNSSTTCSTTTGKGKGKGLIRNKQKIPAPSTSFGYLGPSEMANSFGNSSTNSSYHHQDNNNVLGVDNSAVAAACFLTNNSYSKQQEIITNEIGTNGLINLNHPCPADFKYLTELNDDHSITLDDAGPWMIRPEEGDDEDLLLTNKLLGCNKVTDIPTSMVSRQLNLNLNSASVSNNNSKLKTQLSKPNQLGFNGEVMPESIYGGSGIGSNTQLSTTNKRHYDTHHHQNYGLQLGVIDSLSFSKQQNGLAISHSHLNNNNIPLSSTSFGSEFIPSSDQFPTLNSSYGGNIVNSTEAGGHGFNSVLDRSNGTSSQLPEFNLSDDVDDLADSLDLPIDPEMANQASKLFEEGFDFEFNELFPQDINSDEDFGYPSGLHSGSVRSYGPSESISVAPNF